MRADQLTSCHVTDKGPENPYLNLEHSIRIPFFILHWQPFPPSLRKGHIVWLR